MAATKKPRKKATKKKAKKKVKRRPKLKGEKLDGQVNGFDVYRVVVKDLLACGAPYNPRDITDNHLDGLKASTSKFGLVQPIVWNKRSGLIVGGHQRLKTLDEDDTTDVLVVDLDEAREKALNLALNNPHIAGRFTAALGEMLDQLSVSMPSVMVDLNLSDLYLDVPAEVMDMLFDDDDEEEGDDSPNVVDGGEELLDTDLCQVILVYEQDDHKEMVEILNSIMENEGKSSYTEAVLWLLDTYAS